MIKIITHSHFDVKNISLFKNPLIKKKNVHFIKTYKKQRSKKLVSRKFCLLSEILIKQFFFKKCYFWKKKIVQ